jgi:hypothetical protein
LVSRISWLAVNLAVLLGASAAEAGIIRGRVQVPAPVTRPWAGVNPYPGRAGVAPASASSTQLGAVQDAVVFIEKLPDGVQPGVILGRPPVLEQKNQSFAPRVVVVRAGSKVEFPNSDRIYHNVFSVSPTKRFDLGKYARGHSKAVTFDKPGIVNVFCDIHSDMAAYVVVLPHHVFARPSAAGEFALPELPAGTYTVKVWHPDLGEVTREVKVPEGRDVAVEIEY